MANDKRTQFILEMGKEHSPAVIQAMLKPNGFVEISRQAITSMLKRYGVEQKT